MGDGSQEIAATARCTARAERAGDLRSLLIERLGEVIGPGARVGYLDFPFHTNPGDSMIFEGTMAAFAALSIDVVQLSDQASYRAKDYVSLPADTVMVLALVSRVPACRRLRPVITRGVVLVSVALVAVSTSPPATTATTPPTSATARARCLARRPASVAGTRP